MNKIATSVRLLIALFFLFGVAVEGNPVISLQKRISFQKAIEEVYWKRSIWPAENPQPKPPLSAVFSKSAIRHKTEEYIRKSNALETYWNRSITAEQLQSELNRIAKATRNPELLKEIWNALHNDPYIIAECFVRPILVNRETNRIRGFDSLWQKLGSQANTVLKAPNHRYLLPEISTGKSSLRATATDLWLHLWPTTGTPSPRYHHVAVWTGTVMIVWGGMDADNSLIFKTGARYDPASDSWSSTSTGAAPTARYRSSAIWTGSKMIIWGGMKDFDGTALNNGGVYDPITNQWTLTATTGAPTKRVFHSAVWTGKEMIVWGGGDGFAGSNPTLTTGGRYNPSSNIWTATADAPVGRRTHTAVWTGSQMLVWGGYAPSPSNTGHRYDPHYDSWTAIPVLLAPSVRVNHTAIWTGSEMIIWGGSNDGALNSGGRFDPVSNRWNRPPTLSGAPSARYGHTAIWTGSEMIIWGGHEPEGGYDNHGGRFTPDTNTWTATTITNCPPGISGHTAVWTGTDMIIWGGYNPLLGALDIGGRYFPWFYF